MDYPRRTLGLLSVAVLVGAAPAAFAQAGAPQTLDEQMQQMHQVQPQALPPSVPADAVHEWSGTSPSASPMAANPEANDDNTIDSQGSDAIPSLPLEPQTMGGITFITGGIGDEEVAQLKTSEHEYNFHLLLTSDHGAFISDVNISIMDATGANLLTVQGAGPYFYARFTPGKYMIELSEDGETKKIPVTIKDGKNIKKTVEFHEPGGIVTPHEGTATVE